VPLDPITGQRKYKGGGSVSNGDWRLVGIGLAILISVHVSHDYLGIRLPSSEVLEFVRDISPIVFLWWGLRWARTRQP